MARKAAFHTLGCKVNAYETEAMTERLRDAGYEIVPFAPGADVYVINTCTVTNIADRKSRQMLHRAKELNPSAVVVAAGCYVEDAGGALERDPAVDLVIGNDAKSRLPELLEAWLSGAAEEEGMDDADDANDAPPGIAGVREYDELTVSRLEGRTRAFLKIQDGCNQFCSYCMIPYVRGRVRSRREKDILAEAARLAANGCREIVVTGIHISSYGLDFDYPGENRQTPDAADARTNRRLLSLITKMARVPGVDRLRLGSLEPGIMTEDFVRAIAAIPELCPQFHLSLQSGCDATLARMRRKYRTREYEAICGRLRSHFRDPALTTDLIVGFPGETEEEFAETYAFAERIAFSKIHVFKYSKRTGTRAAAMKEQVPETVKKERSARLLALDRTMRRAYAERFLGREVSVLFEEAAEAEGRSAMAGHTPEALDALCFEASAAAGEAAFCAVECVRGDGVLIVSRKTIES